MSDCYEKFWSIGGTGVPPLLDVGCALRTFLAGTEARPTKPFQNLGVNRRLMSDCSVGADPCVRPLRAHTQVRPYNT